MTTKRGEELTRAQMLGRVAWITFHHEADCMTQKDVAEILMDGCRGYRAASDEELLEEVDFSDDSETPESWLEIDREMADWGKDLGSGALPPAVVVRMTPEEARSLLELIARAEDQSQPVRLVADAMGEALRSLKEG